MRWVLDTSALFHLTEMPMGEVYIGPGVMRELEEYGDNRLPYLTEILTVMSPSKEYLSKVREAAAETGDDARLSPVDLEVLALSMELEATLVSDDYSIQNLAMHLHLPFLTVGKQGIQKKILWRYRCKGCGRVWRELHAQCPVCGKELRSYRSGK